MQTSCPDLYLKLCQRQLRLRHTLSPGTAAFREGRSFALVGGGPLPPRSKRVGASWRVPSRNTCAEALHIPRKDLGRAGKWFRVLQPDRHQRPGGGGWVASRLEWILAPRARAADTGPCHPATHTYPQALVRGGHPQRTHRNNPTAGSGGRPLAARRCPCCRCRCCCHRSDGWTTYSWCRGCVIPYGRVR